MSLYYFNFDMLALIAYLFKYLTSIYNLLQAGHPHHHTHQRTKSSPDNLSVNMSLTEGTSFTFYYICIVNISRLVQLSNVHVRLNVLVIQFILGFLDSCRPTSFTKNSF